MQPTTHAELSWLLAQGLEHRRDRVLVTVAGLIPDLDGLGIFVGAEQYLRYHHVLGHNLLAAAAVGIGGFAFGRKRTQTALLALAAFHLHLLCDLAGSGPGWPLYYLWPFSWNEQFWSGQWDLARWQNGLIAVAGSILCLATALPLRRTIVEIFSRRADAAVVRAIWKRFRPGQTPSLAPDSSSRR
jgi:hypothetical protein